MKAIIFCFALFSVMCSTVKAQTIVTGNVSGTWSVTGSPYMVIDNITISKNNLLKIEPGVEVIIGDSLSIIVSGRIEALGNFENPIIFKAPNEDLYWDKIEVNYSGEISEFKYCDFSNANIAVYLKMVGKITDTMITKIQNCNFIQCDSSGLYGYVYGNSTYSWGGMWSHYPHLNPIIKNCTFTNIPNGCIFYIRGWGGPNAPTTRGYTSPVIQNNIFKNISNTVLKLETGSYAGSSYPSFVNNTIDSCKNGIITQKPYDVVVKNNVFVNCETVIRRSDDLSSDVSYNCFNNNEVNFDGYPGAYGSIVMKNRNDTPCDIGFNIFTDPLFSENNSYKLLVSSPCIDAGDPNSEKEPDNTIADMGAYGGSGAKEWEREINTITSTVNVNNISLSQNYPNPCNKSTTIEYSLDTQGNISIVVFDFHWRKVRTLHEGWSSKGNHKIIWNGKDDSNMNVSGGIYFCQLKFSNHLEIIKMSYIK
jgi:hypothetical protein